jgi:hypothetical protein
VSRSAGREFGKNPADEAGSNVRLFPIDATVGVPSHRYVAKAVPGMGWRVWNRKFSRWWGNFFIAYPEALLAELNGPKRPDRITTLSRSSFAKRQR